MNAHMQINSPVLRQQALAARERRERLWPRQINRVSLHDSHVIAFRAHIATYGTEEEKRKAIMAHRRALIKKWGRYHRASGLAPTEGEMAVERFVEPNISRIIYVVAAHFGMSIADILSHRRQVEIVHARHVAMYLAKVMTTRSLPQIGRSFGDRDHTTVLHAARKIQYLVDHDKDFATEIEAHRRAILDVAHAGA